MSLENPFFLNPLSIEAMQSTAVLLDLDDKFLCWVDAVNLECLEDFLVLKLEVEVALCTKVFLANMGLLELPDSCIVGYVEGLWVLDRSEDKHIETSPPKVLSEHLMHMLDCEETKCKRFEFDGCEWMQTYLSGDDPTFEKFSVQFPSSTSILFV